MICESVFFSTQHKSRDKLIIKQAKTQIETTYGYSPYERKIEQIYREDIKCYHCADFYRTLFAYAISKIILTL